MTFCLRGKHAQYCSYAHTAIVFTQDNPSSYVGATRQTKAASLRRASRCLAFEGIACYHKSMDELKISTEKLDAALSRLETVVDGLLERSADPAATAKEVELLNQDRAKLAEELDAALARERDLKSLADEASSALGSAIKEVEAALTVGEADTDEGQGSVES